LNTLAGHRGILLGDNSATLWQFPSGLTSRYLNAWFTAIRRASSRASPGTF